MEQRTAAVSVRNVTKRFGPVLANDKVCLDIYRGEILALLGENGSGKTTLMNMLSGIYYPDEGEIYINGKPVSISSPKESFHLGIGMIHQHFKLVDVFTAAENIILGLDEKLDMKSAIRKIRKICDQYGFDIDPTQKIYDMSVSQKQTIEIIKVLYRGADILILDEPTAVLTPQETDKLFAILRNMRNAGKAIVIITHKMHEVESLSDRVAVLRKGQYVGDVMTRDTNAEELTNMMVGHPVKLNIERTEPVNPRPRIEVKDLIVRNEEGTTKLDHVSFTANSGEILGIAGIAGSGQKELLEAIAGLQPVDSGSISYIEDDGTHVELIGKDPLTIQNMGAGGSAGHGLGRQHGLIRQHDAAHVSQRALVLHRPQEPAPNRGKRGQGAGSRDAEPEYADSPSVGRQRAESAGRARNHLRTESAADGVRGAWAGHSFLLHDL